MLDERMATIAGRCSRTSAEHAWHPPDVLAMSDRLDVVRVDTATVVAKVVSVEVGRDGSHEQLVGMAMCRRRAASGVDRRVAARQVVTGPIPATISPEPDTRHERIPVGHGHVHAVHAQPLPAVGAAASV